MRIFKVVVFVATAICFADLSHAQVTGPQVLLSTPCRVADTSYSGWLNGPLTPGSEFHVALRGTSPAPGSSQGGASGCGIPNTATAALLNIRVVGPFADGELTAGPYGSPPAVPVLNYTSGQTSNVQVWVVLAAPGHDIGLSVTASTFATVDIVGYTQCVSDCPR